MKKIHLLIFVLSFCACKKSENKDQSVTSEKLITNNLNDNWHNWRSNTVKGWVVDENGIISSDGNQGDLVTNEEYGDYILEFTYKIAPHQNSGVIYKVQEDPDTLKYFASYASGPEFQIIDDQGYPEEIKESQKSGANYDINSPQDLSATKPAGEWNKGKIEIKDNHIKHYLNDKLVAEYNYGDEQWKKLVSNSKFKDWPYATPHQMGKIALQGHGGQVSFKDIIISY